MPLALASVQQKQIARHAHPPEMGHLAASHDLHVTLSRLQEFYRQIYCIAPRSQGPSIEQDILCIVAIPDLVPAGYNDTHTPIPQRSQASPDSPPSLPPTSRAPRSSSSSPLWPHDPQGAPALPTSCTLSAAAWRWSAAGCCWCPRRWRRSYCRASTSRRGPRARSPCRPSTRWRCR